MKMYYVFTVYNTMLLFSAMSVTYRVIISHRKPLADNNSQLITSHFQQTSDKHSKLQKPSISSKITVRGFNFFILAGVVFSLICERMAHINIGTGNQVYSVVTQTIKTYVLQLEKFE